MAANGFLAQDLADLLDLPVERPANVESSALGAAMLAAVGAGIHPTLETAATAMRPASNHFKPSSNANVRQARMAMWDKAVATIV